MEKISGILCPAEAYIVLVSEYRGKQFWTRNNWLKCIQQQYDIQMSFHNNAGPNHNLKFIIIFNITSSEDHCLYFYISIKCQL